MCRVRRRRTSCTHCVIELCVRSPRKFRRKTRSFRSWRPHVDDQGEASEYKFALQALVADHEHAMFDGLEQLLSSAASRCGTCQLDDFKFRPSRQLQSLRMQRHACGDARARRALSLQIFRMHRREVRVWKASKIQRVLQASSWSSMKWLLFTSGGKLKLQPSPDEFAEELGKLFCANPPLPCRPQFLTENAWSMRELLSALRRMKVNKAADEVGLVVELLQHAPSSFLQELLRFYNHVLHTGDVPTSWRKTVFRMLAKFISKASV